MYGPLSAPRRCQHRRDGAHPVREKFFSPAARNFRCARNFAPGVRINFHVQVTMSKVVLAWHQQPVRGWTSCWNRGLSMQFFKSFLFLVGFFLLAAVSRSGRNALGE
jgi:hypothetical protein